MSRAQIRSLKQAVRQGGLAQASPVQVHEARDAALRLLRHSVALKHDRLAILRLVDAVRLRASIEDALWEHCQAVASSQANPGQLRMLKTMRRNT